MFHILGVAMSNNIKRVEPIIDIAGTWYKVCSLNCDMSELQFYYHFAYPKHFKQKLWNFSTHQETGRPEHISFHADGHFQLTLKQDKDKHLERHQSLDGVFLPKENNTITPLLVHSIYPINGVYNLPIINELKSEMRKNVLAHKGAFSVMIFLVPDRFTPLEFLDQPLLNSPYGQITAGMLGSTAGRILAWNGWAIDYILSDLVLHLPAPIKYHSAFAYVDLQPVIRNLFMQRMLQTHKGKIIPLFAIR